MPGKFTFYTNLISGNTAVFPETELRHAIIALRFGMGDSIEFTDGEGGLYKGVISHIGKREFAAEIQSRELTEKKPGLHILCGIIKSAERMEWLVEKCTELGVQKISFVGTGNSERAKVNTERLMKVAVAAMKQSHSVFLPEVVTATWNEAMEIPGKKYIAWVSVKQFVSWSDVVRKGVPTSLFIGPEGDFTTDEIRICLDHGFTPVSLGPQVLRTETACMAASSVYQLQSQN